MIPRDTQAYYEDKAKRAIRNAAVMVGLLYVVLLVLLILK